MVKAQSRLKSQDNCFCSVWPHRFLVAWIWTSHRTCLLQGSVTVEEEWWQYPMSQHCWCGLNELSSTEPAPLGNKNWGLRNKEVTGVFCHKFCKTTWMLKLGTLLILTIKFKKSSAQCLAQCKCAINGGFHSLGYCTFIGLGIYVFCYLFFARWQYRLNKISRDTSYPYSFSLNHL